MFRKFLRIAGRNILHNKDYSILNMFGLALGVACAGLIFLWVENEVGFDSVNVKKDRLYMAMNTWHSDGHYNTYGTTAGPLAAAMKTEIPGVVNTCRYSGDPENALFTIGDMTIYASGIYADSTMLSMLTLPFVEGNPRDAFRQPYSLVITEATAIKFFGDAKNAIGRMVNINRKQNFIVTGVIRDFPSNTTLQFEWVAPFDVFLKDNPRLNYWQSNSVVTLVELGDQANLDEIGRQLYRFIATKMADTTVRTSLFAMKDWHLRWSFEDGKQTGGGLIEYVRMFIIIAWVILLLACINFMNLATARAGKRAKEIGVRKVLGSSRNDLIRHFMGEAMFMSLISVMIAIAMMLLVLPSFNEFTQKTLSLQLSNPLHLAAVATIVVICGLLAGSYPAIYLSSFNPVFVLKGLKLKTSSASLLRRGLVVFQFVVSIALIISTMIIFQQIQHLRKRDLGYDSSNLIVVPAQAKMTRQFDVIKQDLLKTGFIESAALADYEPIYSGQNNDDYTWKGKDLQSKVLISNRRVSPELLGTFGIHLVDGRNFHADVATESNNIIISESLAKKLKKKEVLGEIISENGKSYQIIGVVKDLVYGDIYATQSNPVIFFCTEGASYGDNGLLYLRMKRQVNPAQVLGKIRTVLRQADPSYPFTYKFVDDEINELFLSERMIGILSRIFAALAIVISCFGLFGLAAYTTEQRKKEMGIRKILGATVMQLANSLSRDFIPLIILSAAIAFPVAWYAMAAWLRSYPYRITIDWRVFVTAGVAALLIALLTIGYQTVRTIFVNPTESLRDE